MSKGELSQVNGNSSTPKPVDEIERIGDSMSKMRLLIGRRYIGRVAVARIGAGMELSHLDVMVLVRRLGQAQEVTIGSLAEHMHIDHSRVSRIVAELVKGGTLKRDVSQADARRTIVALTEQGTTILNQMHATKLEVLDATLSGWSTEEIADFARLYEKFTRTMIEQAAEFDAGIEKE